MIRGIAGLLLMGLMGGCSGREKLFVTNQPISDKYYASVHAETPNPKVEREEIGQRLITEWDLPYREFESYEWRIVLTVQFGNRTEERFEHPIRVFEGSWIKTWRGRDFVDKRGIVSYKAELVRDNEIVDTFHHQLWCELIRLDD